MHHFELVKGGITAQATEVIQSISFPAISTGVYRFPIALASTIALTKIVEFLKVTQFGEMKFILFSQQDFDVYENTLKKMLDYVLI